MSKERKNKSRLTKIDVNTICEMQKKIVAYENYIYAMCCMIQHRENLKSEPILLLNDTPLDECMTISWNGLREMKKGLIERKLMEQNNKPTNLVIESYQLQGARQMLSRLLDVYKVSFKDKRGKDDAIYAKAEMDLILSSMNATRRFLSGDQLIRYRGHERDKKGRLVKVEAYYE